MKRHVPVFLQPRGRWVKQISMGEHEFDYRRKGSRPKKWPMGEPGGDRRRRVLWENKQPMGEEKACEN